MENNDKKPPFKQNPFLTFAIFAILALLLFKLFSPNGESLTDKLIGGSVTKEISYNELKELIAKGEISSVSIGQTYIKAYSAHTSPRTLYTTKKVADLGLVPLLDEKKVEYSGFSEGSFLGDLVNMLLPIFIILALWIFLTARMQKSMGGGIFGMGAKSQQFYQLGYENSIEACKEGAVEWCSIQAVALIDGHGVTKDIQKGLEYLEILCERDMENACFMLGTYYFYGINVKQDLQKSKKFTQKALELDSQACGENRLYACVISAEIYQQGLSVPQDLIKAKILYSRACEMDNQFACDYVKKLK